MKSKDKAGRISKVFEGLKARGRKAFIPFITCGFPDLDGTFKLFDLLDSCGADIIEIGIPFSDPLADGPVIQETSRIALGAGINTDTVFDAIRTIRKTSSTPVVLLVYFNTVYVYGIEKFLSGAEKAGVDGIIIPDLPLEEFKKYKHFFDKSTIDNIMIASLTSGRERLAGIAAAGRGFIYCVSLKGVTGIRSGLSDDDPDFLRVLRSVTDLPLALGFGLSTAGQVSRIKNKCDGIIMGSKILDIILKSDDFDKGLKELERFCRGIIKEL
ncbi:MAG: tryptophan synthase subunit alpha [Actinobacteria bacterium]|nr:tryptophan synthase subunit alpha [Actinomycetota bacterium]